MWSPYDSRPRFSNGRGSGFGGGFFGPMNGGGLFDRCRQCRSGGGGVHDDRCVVPVGAGVRCHGFVLRSLFSSGVVPG